MLFEKFVCKIVKKFNLNLEQKIKLASFLISILGFLIELAILFIISIFTNNLLNLLIFLICFSIFRNKKSEHYKNYFLCMLTTTIIYICFLLLINKFNYLYYACFVATVLAFIFKKEV